MDCLNCLFVGNHRNMGDVFSKEESPIRSAMIENKKTKSIEVKNYKHGWFEGPSYLAR